MFQRIVDSIAAKILERVAGGRLAFWRWPNVSRFFSALSFLAVLGLGACNDLSMPDGSDAVAAGQANILVKNTTAETLTVGLDRNADDQGALNDERIEVPAGSEHEFEVEISGDFRKVWLKLPGYPAEDIPLKPKDYEERTADRVFSCVDMQFSSYTTSAKGIKMIPQNPENIAGSSEDNPGESRCQAFAQNLITEAANAAGEANGPASNEHEPKIEDGTRGQEIIKKFSIVIKADYTAKVRFEKLGDLIGFRDQSDKSLVDLTKDGEALELQMTEDPHKFVQENAVPELELNFVDGTAAEISFDDKENWIPLSAIDTPTSQKFEVEYSDADGDELGYLLMANVKASKNGSLLPRTEEVEKEEVEAENKVANGESVTKENYTKDPSKTHELELYSPVHSGIKKTNPDFASRHKVEVTARVDDGMKDGRGRAEVTRTLYVNVAPEIEALQFGDGTDVSDIVETEKDNWLQLDSGDKTSFSVAATDLDDGTDLTYTWKVNGTEQPGKNTAAVELDLGSTGAHEVKVAVTVSDGVKEVSETRTLFVNVAPTQPTEIKEVERGQLVPGESERKYTLEPAGGKDLEGDQLGYEWQMSQAPNPKDDDFTPFEQANKQNSSKVNVTLRVNKTYTIRARLKDKYGGKGKWFEENIKVENHEPRIKSLLPQDSVWDDKDNNYKSWIQLSALDRPVTKTFTVEAEDADGDILTYSWEVNEEKQPGKNKANVLLSQDFLASASKDKDHKVVVVVTVGDSVEKVSETRTYYVNVAPKITELKADGKDVGSMTTAEHNSWLQLDKKDQLAKLSVAATDADDGADLTYTWTVNGNEKKKETGKDGETLLLDLSSTGAHEVEVAVTVDDGNGGKHTLTRTLYVNVKPTRPTEIKATPGKLVEKNPGSSARKYTLALVGGMDPDGDQLEYEWEVNGIKDFVFTPENPRNVTVELPLGPHTIRVRLKDEHGGEGAWFVSKEITVGNNAPKITGLKFADGTDVQDSIGDETSVFPPSGLIQKIKDMADPSKLKPTWVQLNSGEKTSFSVAATDADDDDLTYTWTVNGTEQPGKNTAAVEMDLSSTGAHEVEVAVTANDGMADSQKLTRTLFVNVAPKIPEISTPQSGMIYKLKQETEKDDEGDEIRYEWQLKIPTKTEFGHEYQLPLRNYRNKFDFNTASNGGKGKYILRVRSVDEHGGVSPWCKTEIEVK